jgi:hypothetical protein
MSDYQYPVKGETAPAATKLPSLPTVEHGLRANLHLPLSELFNTPTASINPLCWEAAGMF